MTATRETLRQAGRLIARHFRLDPAAEVMVGAIAATGQRGGATPSAEERAELLAIAGTDKGFSLFVDSATSRANQFATERWRMILAHAERLETERRAVSQAATP